MSRPAHPTFWRLVVSVVAVGTLAAALSACGSSSGSTATTERSEGATTTSVGEEGEESREGEGAEAELEEIVRVKIHGKLGGNRKEFELSSGARCRIVKINTTPASVKADGKAILDQEKNASVQVAPLKGATAVECRKAAEFAIG